MFTIYHHLSSILYREFYYHHLVSTGDSDFSTIVAEELLRVSSWIAWTAQAAGTVPPRSVLWDKGAVPSHLPWQHC